MLFLLNSLFVIAGGVILLMTAILSIEIALAKKAHGQAEPAETGQHPATVVLIPAHNEEGQIGATLNHLKARLGSADRILVVADNCSDKTAIAARASGTTVIERHDLEKRGKGYALQYGLDYLAEDPPDVVFVLDADCLVGPNTIRTLADKAAARNLPVQALNLMEAGSGAGIGEKLSAFAFAVKNWARPKGLGRMGLPCPLTGTGMAFPYAMIRNAGIGTGHIVEDMKLGIDLALAGYPARLEDSVKITSSFPTNSEGRASQRRRWEHGHLSMIMSSVPRLIGESIRLGRPSLFAVALDLMIPPLSLLVILLVTALVAAGALAVFGGSPLPLGIVVAACLLAAFSLTRGWLLFGRDIITARELLSIPAYVAGKLPLYFDFIRRRERQWVRTARDDENGGR